MVGAKDDSESDDDFPDELLSQQLDAKKSSSVTNELKKLASSSKETRKSIERINHRRSSNTSRATPSQSQQEPQADGNTEEAQAIKETKHIQDDILGLFEVAREPPDSSADAFMGTPGTSPPEAPRGVTRALESDGASEGENILLLDLIAQGAISILYPSGLASDAVSWLMGLLVHGTLDQSEVALRCLMEQSKGDRPEDAEAKRPVEVDGLGTMLDDAGCSPDLETALQRASPTVNGGTNGTTKRRKRDAAPSKKCMNVGRLLKLAAEGGRRRAVWNKGAGSLARTLIGRVIALRIDGRMRGLEWEATEALSALVEALPDSEVGDLAESLATEVATCDPSRHAAAVAAVRSCVGVSVEAERRLRLARERMAAKLLKSVGGMADGGVEDHEGAVRVVEGIGERLKADQKEQEVWRALSTLQLAEAFLARHTVGMDHKRRLQDALHRTQKACKDKPQREDCIDVNAQAECIRTILDAC